LSVCGKRKRGICSGFILAHVQCCALSWLLLLQGVCCSDKKHCCPHGYECNSSTLTCDPASQSILWKSLAVKNVDGVPSNDVVCPGGQQSCPDQTTCCVMQSGHYGCCRYDQVLVTSYRYIRLFDSTQWVLFPLHQTDKNHESHLPYAVGIS